MQLKVFISVDKPGGNGDLEWVLFIVMYAGPLRFRIQRFFPCLLGAFEFLLCRGFDTFLFGTLTLLLGFKLCLFSRRSETLFLRVKFLTALLDPVLFLYEPCLLSRQFSLPSFSIALLNR